MAPVICKFFQKGECRFGDQCKFDHPRDLLRNENRFAAFQTNDNTSRNGYGRNQGGGRQAALQTPAYSLSKDIISADLSTERPQWILSAYGPGSKAPAQLFGGSAREQSFEEMRLHYYNGVASGNPGLAIQQANILVQEAEMQMRNVLNDIDGAMDFIRRAENEHPNRIDICQASTKAQGSAGISSTPSGPSNGISTQSTPGFGQPSVLGVKSSPFGVPQQLFGQSSLPGSTGIFGQPSALGRRPNPFGAPPGEFGLGQGTGNATGPFSAFATKTNPFGTPTKPVVANLFGQAGQSAPTAPFGQDAAQNENPFTQSAMRPNPFGPPTNQLQPGFFASTPTPFGVPSPAAQQSPSGSLSQPGQGNPLGQQVTQALLSNPFSQSKPTASLSNLFAHPTSTSSPNPLSPVSAQTGPRSNLLASSGQISQPKANGTASQGPDKLITKFQHPALESYASQDGSQRLRMFKGKPVVYKDNEAGFQNRDGTWEKIWFPDGPPAYYGATELGDDAYTEDIRMAYLYLRETGSFKDGIMPLLPPKRDWCLWDF